MRILVIGGSGHASVVIDSLLSEGVHQIAGVLDDRIAVGERVLSATVLGKLEDLPALMKSEGAEGAIVAIGDNWVRRQVVHRIRSMAPALAFPRTVHPRASVAESASIGEGSVILAGAVINCRTRVGAFCIVNTRASLDHDCVLEDFACLLPGATAGGNVTVGTGTAICLGANLIHGVRIGESSVIGAGSTVLSDIPPNQVAFGCPARVIRPRQAGDPYL